MEIKVNGEPMQLAAAQISLSELLQQLGIDAGTQGIAVAVNMELVPRGEWAHTSLSPGAAIEIITARQGG